MSRPKPDLSIRWSKPEKALLYTGNQTAGLLAMYFEKVKLIDAYCMRNSKIHNPWESDERSLAQELDARGYDLTTLRFSIRKKAT